jgi:uncharacterized delta-60 repeat protein
MTSNGTVLVRAVVACVLIVAHTTAARALPGDLDPTFGRGGKLRLRVSERLNAAKALLVQPDGKIVAAGYTSLDPGDRPSELAAVVVRLLPDGAIDPSFGSAGAVVIRPRDREATADVVALQPDGRIVVAGGMHKPRSSRTRLWVARLLPDGAFDGSFGQNGMVTIGFEGGDALCNVLLLTRDGKILVGGGVHPRQPLRWPTLALARYLPDGRLDPAFARHGRLHLAGVAPANRLAEQKDGALVAVLGFGFSVARFLADGSLDPTFGDSGIVRDDLDGFLDSTTAVAIGADGTILVGGYAYARPSGSEPDFALARFLPDGSVDATFGAGGRVLTRISRFNDWLLAMSLRPDGRIVVAGYTYAGFPFRETRFALARYRPDGSLDPSFGVGGVVLTAFRQDAAGATGLALQGNDRLVVAGTVYETEMGTSALAFARYEW